MVQGIGVLSLRAEGSSRSVGKNQHRVVATPGVFALTRGRLVDLKKLVIAKGLACGKGDFEIEPQNPVAVFAHLMCLILIGNRLIFEGRDGTDCGIHARVISACPRVA